MSAKEITYFRCGYLFCIVISISNNIGLEFKNGSDIGLELPITRTQFNKPFKSRMCKEKILCFNPSYRRGELVCQQFNENGIGKHLALLRLSPFVLIPFL